MTGDTCAAQCGEILRVGCEHGDGGVGGEGGGAEHGVDGVLVAVQAGVGEEGGSVAGDGLGDRFDDKAGQRPLPGR